jgi:hypothetical protein
VRLDHLLSKEHPCASCGDCCLVVGVVGLHGVLLGVLGGIIDTPVGLCAPLWCVGLGGWHAVGCLRHQTSPSIDARVWVWGVCGGLVALAGGALAVCGGGAGVGLLFELWIVDASIFVAFLFCVFVLIVVWQAMKGAWWMPWHREPKKDVGACDKPWGVGNRALIRGCPNGETWPESCLVTCT